MQTHTLSAAVEEITPDIAQNYLLANKTNRRINEKSLASLTQDMANGYWKLTGEAIKFDTENNLIDGQHRLLAIQRTGVSVPLLVIRGVETDTQLVMDTGSRRTGANALEIMGAMKETTLRAAIATIGVTDDMGKLNLSNSLIQPVTHSQIIDWVSSHDLDNALRWGARVHRVLRGSKSSICYAYYKIAQVSETSAQHFFDDIADLSTSGAGDPKHTLVNKINKNRDYFRGSGYRAKYIFHFLRAWEASYLGQDLRMLRDTVGKKPMAMPDLSRYIVSDDQHND